MQTLSHGSGDQVEQVKQQDSGKEAGNQQQQSKTGASAWSHCGFLHRATLIEGRLRTARRQGARRVFVNG